MTPTLHDHIRRALHAYIQQHGQEALEAPTSTAFLREGAPPVGYLLHAALCGLSAYARLKHSNSRNQATDVANLARELHKVYFVAPAAALAAVECIAELLGYMPPLSMEAAPFALPQVGDTVPFGDYTWRVLDIKDDTALLLSEHITEQRAYHPCYDAVTWETSSLRQYLNTEFIRIFSDADRARMVPVTVPNANNHWYGIPGGADTVDTFFVLSLEEADRYFGNSGDYLHTRRKSYQHGAYVPDNAGWVLSNAHDASRIATYGGRPSLWWLRSPGYSDCTVAYVSTTGHVPPNGDRVCIGRGGVRPAVWVGWNTLH